MASITLTVPDDQVARIRAAFASAAGVDPSAFTAEDMRQAIIRFVKSVVRHQEMNAALQQIDEAAAAQKSAFVPVADPDVT